MAIEVLPLTPTLGAEIRGADLLDLDDAGFAQIFDAFVAHSVIFFRDQPALTEQQHLDVASRFGDIHIHPFARLSDRREDAFPGLLRFHTTAQSTVAAGNRWHSDVSCDDLPPQASILQLHEIPPVGGDTLFASMYAAYEGLSDELKQKLGSMRAEHSSRHAFGKLDDADEETKKDLAGRLANASAATQDAVHPVIIRHPLSGRPALYVNGDFTVRFEGWTQEESQPLLDELYAHASSDEYTGRFSWEVGSMAIWDNRAVHHKALNDYSGERRLMHRITLEGEPLEAASN